MAGVSQGTLNRARVSVNVVDNPELNIIASMLGKEGVTITRHDDSTLMIPTMTGMATSPVTYVGVDIVIHLVKTLNVATLWEAREKTLSTVGNIKTRGDSSAVGDNLYENCAIKTVDALKFNGEDIGYMIHLSGTYQINSSLFNL